MEVVDTEFKELSLLKREATSGKSLLPDTLSFLDYQEAGGIFNKDDYAKVIHEMKRTKKFLPVHIKQAEVLASAATTSSNLSLSEGKVKVASSFYAALRGAEDPSLAALALTKTDQRLFAEALRATQGKKAYLEYIGQYPNIFKT